MLWYRELGTSELLIIFLFVVLYALFIFRTHKKAKSLQTSSKYVWVKFALRSTYFVLLMMALLGPSFGKRKQEVKAVGKDIFYLVDLSRSMDARDVQPSRMERIKHELKGISASFAADRQGIIIFSAEAFLQCPLTSDRSALLMIIESLNTGLVPSGGTDFGPPLQMAVTKFNKETQTKNNAKVIVMISDGEDFGEDTDEAIDAIEDLKIKVFTLGVGTEEGGKIPAGGGFKKDPRTGKEIVTALNSSDLKSLAKQTGGRYYEISDSQNDVQRLINAIQGLDGEVRDVKQLDASANKYFYFLLAALALVIIDVLFTVKIIKV